MNAVAPTSPCAANPFTPHMSLLYSTPTAYSFSYAAAPESSAPWSCL